MKPLRLAVIALALFSACAARADAPKAAAYVPGLGEIMGATQMRHAKLWFAGKAGNWELAAYELGELREGLDNARVYRPVFKGAPVAGMLDQYMSGALADLGQAIKEKNSTKFGPSFDSLTAACNSCHAAVEHGYIVITRPTAPPFSNQEFSHPN